MKPIFFETPMAIVAILEFGHGGTNFFEVLEDAAMEHLFLERPVEPFGNWA